VAGGEAGTGGGHGAGSGLDRTLERLARLCAVSGALCLALIAATVFVSVSGRALRLWSIRGDFELVEAGCAAAVFLFLPVCQQRRWHVSVDLFTSWLPQSVTRVIEAAGEFLFALAWAVIVWRMVVGGIETFHNQDRTMVLHLPLWIVYLPALAGIALAAVIALRNAVQLMRGRGHAAGSAA